MTDFIMPSKTELSGLIDAGDVEKVLNLWELSEEAILSKAEEIDNLTEAYLDYERRYKTDLKSLKREQSGLRLNAKKLFDAKLAAGRRQRISDNFARR